MEESRLGGMEFGMQWTADLPMDSAGWGRGFGVDQLPAVEHQRQPGEADRGILPGQPLVGDVATHLRRGLLGRPRHALVAGRLAPLKRSERFRYFSSIT